MTELDVVVEAVVEYFAGKEEELPHLLENLRFVEMDDEFGVQFNNIESLWKSGYDKHFRSLFKKTRGTTLESSKMRFKIAIAICALEVHTWGEDKKTVENVIHRSDFLIRFQSTDTIFNNATIVSIVENMIDTHD